MGSVTPPTAEEPARRLAPAVAVGVVAGALSGLFGVGGGILIVPGLVLFLGLGQRRAHGTSLAAVVPIAVAGVGGYALSGKVDWPVAAGLAAGAIGGSLLGSHALHVLPTRVLGTAFAATMLLTAARLLVDVPEAGGRGSFGVGMAVGLLAIGAVTGVLSGLLGVGGGIVMVPAMMLILSMPAALAKGTSLAVIIPAALTATWRNTKNGNADLRLAAGCGFAGVVSAFAMSRLSVGMDPTLSTALFGGLLVVLAARMLLQVRARPHAPALVAAPVVDATVDRR